MMLEHSNKPDQQSSLLRSVAKMDPYKLNCEIAFVACQQAECMWASVSIYLLLPLLLAHFTFVLLIFLFHYFTPYSMESARSVNPSTFLKTNEKSPRNQWFCTVQRYKSTVQNKNLLNVQFQNSNTEALNTLQNLKLINV